MLFQSKLDKGENEDSSNIIQPTVFSPTEEEINSVIDVLDVNAFEIRGNDFSIRGVYPLTAMMNSVCSPNTQNCIGNFGKIFKKF